MLKKMYWQIFSEKKRIKNRLLLYKIFSVFYVGNKYSCNCCGKSFRKFRSKGTKLVTRQNAMCPYCISLERTRTLLFYIEKETNLLNDKLKLLHFAPEWCLIPIFKQAKNLEYYSADINPNYADFQVDITNIPFADATFDYVICSHVLGHVPDEKKAVKEIFRVLKPNGVALVLTIINSNNPHTFETSEANTPEKRLQYYSEQDLLRLHGTDFEQRLKSGGFHVETIDYRKKMGEEIWKKYALGDGKRELIFKCTK